jgi:hypothetical protein
MGAFKVARGSVSSDSSSDDAAVLGMIPYVAYLCGYKGPSKQILRLVKPLKTDGRCKSGQSRECLWPIARLTLIVGEHIQYTYHTVTYLYIRPHHGDLIPYCLNKTIAGVETSRYYVATAVGLLTKCDRETTAYRSFGFA